MTRCPPYPCGVGNLGAQGQFLKVIGQSLTGVDVKSPAKSSHLQVTKDCWSSRRSCG